MNHTKIKTILDSHINFVFVWVMDTQKHTNARTHARTHLNKPLYVLNSAFSLFFWVGLYNIFAICTFNFKYFWCVVILFTVFKLFFMQLCCDKVLLDFNSFAYSSNSECYRNRQFNQMGNIIYESTEQSESDL